MSDDSSLEEMVVEETTDRLDVSAVLGEGSLEDGIDADEIGTAVGARLGERVGRSLGEEIGGAVHESLATGIQQGKGLREMLADVAAAVRGAVVDAMGEVEDASGIVSTLHGALEDTGVEESLSDAAPTDALESGADALEGATGDDSGGAEPAAEEAEDDGPETEGEEGEAEDTAESEAEAESETDEESGRSAEELEDLRRETLEDFLDVMSYEDLQSVAKEVGVKANLSREEMSERIVETVAGDAGSSEESSDGESEESAGNESQSDGEAA